MSDEKTSLDKKNDKKLLEDRKIAILTILEVMRSKSYFFILTVSLTLIGTFLGHYLKIVTYKTNSTLYVQNTEQPSAAEYLLHQQIFKLSRVDRIESYINHLNSDSFLFKIAETIKFNKEFRNLLLVAPQKKSKLGVQYWKNYFFGKEEATDFSQREKRLLMPIEKIVAFLRKTVKFKTDYNSQFIRIHVDSLDAATSQLVANLIAKEFVAITNEHSLNEVLEVEKFVATKKDDIEKQVKEFDKQLISFKQKNNIISADATTRSFANRLSGLEKQIQDAMLQKTENDKILASLTQGRARELSKIFKNGSKSKGFDAEETSTLIHKKINQLNKQKSAFLAQGYSESNWQVEKLNIEIDKNVQILKNLVSDPKSQTLANLNPVVAQKRISETQEKLRSIKARIATLRSARKDLQKQVDLMPNMQQEYIRLENQFKTAIEELSNLERKEKELEIQRISFKKEVKVDQLAGLPGPTPRGSLFMKLIFSSFAALFLGLLIVLALESLDPTVKSRQDMYDCGLDFFGEVPFVKNEEEVKKRKGRFQFGSPNDLVCKNKPESIESMSFKYMRARIESMRYKEHKDSQVITLSSALHNEGKSFVAANLAISLSQLQRKVILVDADLRRPSQSAYFGITTSTGLVDLLAVKKTLDEVLITNQLNNLHILPAGISGADSTELISSQKFRLLIEHLRKEYEYVVIDTPPTFAVVDAAIVSSFADIAVLVSSFRETRKADLYEAYNDILQVSYKNVFGIINKAIVSNSRIHYYGYPLYTDTGSRDVSAFQTTSDEEAQEFLENLKKHS